MTFHVGQKVVCVDDRGCNGQIREGNVYTVLSINWPWLRVPRNDGVKRGPESQGYLASRFRPVVARKTDISIFTAMLTPKKAKEPA